MRDAAWSARVIDAGVRLDLFESADGDYAFALLGLTITRAVSEAALSDDDAYPLLVRYWNGTWPEVGWPRDAPAVARRCAMALAERGGCAMERALYVPTDASLQAARDAIIAELGLTQRDLSRRRSRSTGSGSTPWRCQADGAARCWRSRAMSCSSRSSARAR